MKIRIWQLQQMMTEEVEI